MTERLPFTADDVAHYRRVWDTLTAEEQTRLGTEARSGDQLAAAILAVVLPGTGGSVDPPLKPGRAAFKATKEKLAARVPAKK